MDSGSLRVDTSSSITCSWYVMLSYAVFCGPSVTGLIEPCSRIVWSLWYSPPVLDLLGSGSGCFSVRRSGETLRGRWGATACDRRSVCLLDIGFERTIDVCDRLLCFDEAWRVFAVLVVIRIMAGLDLNVHWSVLWLRRVRTAPGRRLGAVRLDFNDDRSSVFWQQATAVWFWIFTWFCFNRDCDRGFSLLAVFSWFLGGFRNGRAGTDKHGQLY